MGRNNTQFFHVVKEQEYDVASIFERCVRSINGKRI